MYAAPVENGAVIFYQTVIFYYTGVCARIRMYIEIASSILGEYHRDFTISVMSATSDGGHVERRVFNIAGSHLDEIMKL